MESRFNSKFMKCTQISLEKMKELSSTGNDLQWDCLEHMENVLHLLEEIYNIPVLRVYAPYVHAWSSPVDEIFSYLKATGECTGMSELMIGIKGKFGNLMELLHENLNDFEDEFGNCPEASPINRVELPQLSEINKKLMFTIMPIVGTVYRKICDDVNFNEEGSLSNAENK